MTNIQRDAYAWRFVYGSAAFVGVLAAQMKALEFFPAQPPQAGIAFGLRLALDLALPLVFAVVCGFALWLAVTAALALLRRRLRRALSLTLALIAIPVLFVAQAELIIFDPYYWYVRANEKRLEAGAKAVSKADAPAFAVIETRDVSIGMVTTPPRFASIVYDESGEIALAPANRSEAWRKRNQAQLELAAGGYADSWQWVLRLFGHFFVLRAGG